MNARNEFQRYLEIQFNESVDTVQDILSLYDTLKENRVMSLAKHLMVAALYYGTRNHPDIDSLRLVCHHSGLSKKKVRSILKRFVQSVYARPELVTKFYTLTC